MASWEPRFDLSLDLNNPDLLRAAIRGEELAAVIRGIRVPPQIRASLDRLNIARAVRGTTAIEGAVISEAEVERVMAQSGQVLPASRSRDEREARNAAEVAALVAQTLNADPQRPLTEAFIRELNAVLTGGLDYVHHSPGRYRAHGVSVGTYSPPSGPAIEPLMRRFVEWVNSSRVAQWPAVVRAAAAHFFLVTIHPFGDGNGRTSRAVESYLLYQAGINAFGFYSLSNFYYRNQRMYIEKLEESRLKVDLTPFVLFAAQGLVEEMQAVHADVLTYLDQLAFRDFARRRIEEVHPSAKLAARLLDFAGALSEGVVLVADLRRGAHPLSRHYHGASIRTLERDVAMLERLGLARRAEGEIRGEFSALEA